MLVSKECCRAHGLTSGIWVPPCRGSRGIHWGTGVDRVGKPHRGQDTLNKRWCLGV